MKLTYSIRDGEESITEIPQEPLESLLLRIRRLTMRDSAEHLLGVQKVLKQSATDADRRLLDVWQKYWRLAFIKEPFEVEQAGKQEVMIELKVFECFINGHYFHTNIPEYNIIYDSFPTRAAKTYLYFQNMFHSVVMNIGLAAIGLHRYINNGNSFAGLPLNNGIATVFGFIWKRNRVPELDEQYKVFSDWVEQHGGCEKGRWS